MSASPASVDSSVEQALSVAVAALEGGRPQAALAPLRQALARAPEDPRLWYDLGLTLQRLERFSEAAWALRRAIQHGGDGHRVWTALGQSLAALGAFPAARACFTEAISRADDALAFFHLAHCQRFRRPPPYLGRLRRLAESSRHPPRVRSLAAFALGKLFDDLAAPARAFPWFRLGNRLQGPAYDEAGHARYDAACRRAGVAGGAVAGHRPLVLLVGMPRSGSTLLARCLARHPRIRSLGERPWLRQALESHGYPWRWHEVGAGARQAAARAYLRRLPAGGGWVLDKSLMNGFHLGAVGTLLPQAKVILCRRHPLDVGLSCFFQRFEGHAYSRDLHHLGRFMGRYLGLLAHWQAQLGSARVLEVHYEALVRAPERTLRRVLDFLDLPWEAACLDPAGGEEAVTTASQWQVRQGWYEHAIGRWRRYRPWLAPLAQALEANAQR